MSIQSRVNDEESNICKCCGYPAVELEEYPGPCTKADYGRQGKQLLCEICASTHLSSGVSYPLLYSDKDRYLFGALGWIGNRLLEAIHEGGRDALGDMVRNMPVGPPEDLDIFTCHKCGCTYQVRRKTQFMAPSLPAEDPGCPKCGLTA